MSKQTSLPRPKKGKATVLGLLLLALVIWRVVVDPTGTAAAVNDTGRSVVVFWQVVRGGQG